MGCYLVRGKAAQRDVWDDFLIVEKHPLPHIAGDGFQRWGWSCFSFTPDTGHNWSSLGESAHPIPPLLDFTPLLALLGFEHKLDHLRSSSRIVHRCIATDPVLPRLHWDIWCYSGYHLFLRRDCSQNWDPWYAHLSAALVAARHVMWQTKLCTQYYLKFPIKDEQKGDEEWLVFSISYNMWHTVPLLTVHY